MHRTTCTSNALTTTSNSNKDDVSFAFAVSFFAFMATQLYMNVQSFPYDSGIYWSLSAHIWDFSFPEQIRGYFYPLLLSPFRILYDYSPVLGLSTLKIITSLFYAYIFGVLLPTFYRRTFGGSLTTSRRFIPSVLIAIIFPGLIAYTLSDAPSFALTIGAASAASAGITTEKIQKKLCYFILSGLLAYFAYNTRTIYIVSIVALCLLIFCNTKASTITRGAWVLTFLMGALLGSTPQIAINEKYHDTPSPFVIANLSSGSLFVSQLVWGIVVDRYETYSPINGPGSSVFYANSTGENLLRVNDARKITSIQEYFRLVASNPVAFATIYASHIASGLEVRDGEVYTKSPSSEKSLLALFSLVVVLFGLSQLFRFLFIKKSEASLIEKLGWGFVFLGPCFAIIPGAIETRFFFPVICLSYVALASGFQIEKESKLSKSQWIIPALITLAMYAFTQQSIKNPIYDRPESRIYNYNPN